MQYGYGADGKVTSVKDQPTTTPATQDNQCFGFDGLRRLQSAWTSATGACTPPGSASDVGGVKPYWSDYQYDQLGNLILGHGFVQFMNFEMIHNVDLKFI